METRNNLGIGSTVFIGWNVDIYRFVKCVLFGKRGGEDERNVSSSVIIVISRSKLCPSNRTKGKVNDFRVVPKCTAAKYEIPKSPMSAAGTIEIQLDM